MMHENTKYAAEMLITICTSKFVSKCIFSLIYIFFSFSFSEFHHTALLSILILIIFDFVTGLYAAKVSGEEIRSRKVFRSALKVVFYFMIISGGHLTERAIGLDIFLDETAMGFLAATELISIIENIGKIGFAVPKKILNKLEKFTE